MNQGECRVPKKITSREAWIELGFQQFSIGGTEALRIEAMARTLGVSKASFYHFFKGRDAFIDDILGYWRNIRTEEFIKFSKDRTEDVSLIEALILEIFSADIDDDFLFHLRRFGRKNHAARELLVQVEAQRVDFARHAIEQLGYPQDDAHEKSVVIYNYYLGWRERQKTNRDGTAAIESELGRLVSQLNLTQR